MVWVFLSPTSGKRGILRRPRSREHKPKPCPKRKGERHTPSAKGTPKRLRSRGKRPTMCSGAKGKPMSAKRHNDASRVMAKPITSKPKRLTVSRARFSQKRKANQAHKSCTHGKGLRDSLLGNPHLARPRPSVAQLSDINTSTQNPSNALPLMPSLPKRAKTRDSARVARKVTFFHKWKEKGQTSNCPTKHH